MKNLSKIAVNPEQELMIVTVENYQKLKKENEKLEEINKVQQTLMRTYYDDIHRLKKENKELKSKYEFNP